MRRLGLPIGPAVIALVLVLLLLAAAGFLAGCGGGTLTAHDVKLAAATVQSAAAEAALTAGGVARGRSAAPFVRVHAGELAVTAGSTARQLGSASGSTPALTAAVRDLARISGQTRAQLLRLGAAPRDRALAADVAARCSMLAAQAWQLARS